MKNDDYDFDLITENYVKRTLKKRIDEIENSAYQSDEDVEEQVCLGCYIADHLKRLKETTE